MVCALEQALLSFRVTLVLLRETVKVKQRHLAALWYLEFIKKIMTIATGLGCCCIPCRKPHA